MTATAIGIEHLSKKYVIGHDGRGDEGLRHRLERAVRNPFRRGRVSSDSADTEFWALRDVSFEINHGDVVGIIGRNGAGKSTLLKVLSRITEPTSGRVRIRGRIASLLEVGTGFHQDLTGRENIFLNGAILGMARTEIKRKFDEIVDFADVEQFLDTPVKRYSSGMYMRLAFAVAAHLEPEILIVDEVLAVGDQSFQKKCLGKMSDVSRSGRTVLFVSHNMGAVSMLCTRGVLLERGRKIEDGTAGQAIERYLQRAADGVGSYEAKPNGKAVQVVSVSLPSLSPSGVHISGDALRVRIAIRSDTPIRNGCLGIQIVNYVGTPVLHLRPHDHGVFWGDRAGLTILECEVPNCWLNVGSYQLRIDVIEPPGGKDFERMDGVCPFDVEVHHATAWYGWRPDFSCYIPPERWTAVHPTGN